MTTGTTKAFVFVLLLVCAGAATAQQAVRHVQLQEFTRLELDLVPDLGTRLTFPFLLTEQRSAVPFHTYLTNSAIFSVLRPVKGSETIPHNSLVVTVNTEAAARGEEYIGHLFITAGGYHVTVLLRTTQPRHRHVQDVIFDLTGEERRHLVDDAVNARLAEMEQHGTSDVDAMARREARRYVARVALEDPRSHAIKEARKKAGVAKVYLQRFLAYADYLILVFEVKNLGAGDLRVVGAQLAAGDGETTTGVIDSHYDCPSVVAGDRTVDCALVMETPAALDAPELTFSLLTDRGQVDVAW